MPHRSTPTADEVLPIMRLLADVSAVRDGPVAQSRLLVDGLSDLFHTTLGWLSVLDDWRPGGSPRLVAGVVDSRIDPVCRRYLADLAAHVPPASDPYVVTAMADPADEQLWTFGQVLPDAAARRRHAVAVDVIDRGRIGDGAVGLFRTGPGRTRVVGLSFHRCHGEGRVSAREHALHRFALREVRRLVERGTIVVCPPPSASIRLPPRRRAVFDALLAGGSAKTIGRAVSMSVWTVRDHVKAIYAAHDVHTREELMAKFVRRP